MFKYFGGIRNFDLTGALDIDIQENGHIKSDRTICAEKRGNVLYIKNKPDSYFNSDSDSYHVDEDNEKREEEVSEKETKYYLDETCNIEKITQSDRTTLNVSSKWLNSSLNVNITGDSKYKLPRGSFSRLNLTASGNSGIYGNASASTVVANACGASLINGIHAINSAKVNGSGVSTVKITCSCHASIHKICGFVSTVKVSIV